MGLEGGRVSNAMGVPINQWIMNQLNERSKQTKATPRDTDNIIYQGNKTAWIRLVSSVDIVKQEDRQYFINKGLVLSKESDLAKKFVLQGGTVKFNEDFSYSQRSGISDAYNVTQGSEEISKYGYRPMPGITSVKVNTQGKMGSIRSADIQLKVWDKDQLDIIDALFFKLGYTMFLEWGHTYYYEEGTGEIKQSETYSINPFTEGLTKEKIYNKISKNVIDSQGNYDAMLGMVTNFNFSYNQEGGYDCTIKLMALGVLASGIKINNPKILPDLQKDTIKILVDTLIKIKKQEDDRNLGSQNTTGQELPKLVTIDEALKALKAQNPDSFRSNSIIPSAPEKITTTSITSQTGNTTNSTITTQIVPTGEYYPPDHIVELDNGKKYVYLSRIGQVVEYDRDSVNRGYINIDKLDTFKSDLSGLGFVSNIVLSKNENNLYKKKYGISPFAYKYEYKADAKDYKGVIGKVDKFIGLEYSPIKVGLREGQDLEKDVIVPAIKEAIAQELSVSVYYNVALKSFVVDFKGKYKVKVVRTTEKDASDDILLGDTSAVSGQQKVNAVLEGNFRVYTDDTSVIKDIITGKDNNFIERQKYLESINSQNKQEIPAAGVPESSISVSEIQKSEALKYQSAFEVIVRTIQLYSLNNAINTGIEKESPKVSVLNLANSPEHKNFTKNLFSVGLFSNYIDKLISTDLSEIEKDCDEYDALIDKGNIPEESMIKLRSRFGFNFSLMGNKISAKSMFNKKTLVDYTELMKTYTVPYRVNIGVFEGTQVNHPVYIKLGFVIMIINQICNIYDVKNDAKNTTPLVYFDFNPSTNTCLSNAKQLSTNPYDILIPFEGFNSDFKSIIDPSVVIDEKFIRPVSGSIEKTRIYEPEDKENGDRLSASLPRFKIVDSTDKSEAYRGKTMNILVSTDYLLKTVANYSKQDQSNDIYAKEFIEQILFDVNKYLGDFNMFRLAYDDSGNTFHIADDQMTPNLENSYIAPTNKTEFPLFGLGSLARTIEIKTEIASKLSNMIAISANSTKEGLSSLSKTSDSFGFYNLGYSDRYIPSRGDLNITSSRVTDAMINSAIQFNKAIETFYSDTTPADTSVSHATNYFIERMSRIKGDEKGSRASAVIPVSLNFSTDGISGLGMGQAFTVSQEFLPYTYDLSLRDPYGESDKIHTVGFVVVGLDQSIEGNQWISNVRANMMFLKQKQDFEQASVRTEYAPTPGFKSTQPPPLGVDEYPDTANFSNYPTQKKNYSNILFGKGPLGNPGAEPINPTLLDEINSAAVLADTIVTITTGIGGHKTKSASGAVSRHAQANAVDIAIVDNVRVRPDESNRAKVDKFVAALINNGYIKNAESGNRKAVLTFGFSGHDNHIHVSYDPTKV